MRRINIRYLALSFILIMSLALGAGCTMLPGLETTPPSNHPATEEASPTESEWSIPVGERSSPALPSIADVVAKVKPSVVAIATEVVTVDFFNRPSTQEGAGSGWIISQDGYIVTNNHVIQGARTITVTLDDGRTVPAQLVGADPLTDLAVLRIDAENLSAATMGDSLKLRVGDWVVAIGNSLGRGTRATQGIVSRQGVSIPVDRSQTLYGLIETDAAINPGNSGGPLVNMAGEVIGINSAKIAQVGVEGMGYAISSQEAAPIIQQLINTGFVVRPWLGVSLYPVNQYVAERFGLTIDTGAFVVVVAADSPADTAGLRPEDVIVAFAGKEIITVDDLIQAIRSAQIGQKIEITFWRGKNEKTTHTTLIESLPPS